MSEISDLTEIRELKKDLEGSTADSMIVAKLLQIIDRASDLIDAHRDQLNALTERVNELEEQVEDMRIDLNRALEIT